MKRDNKSLTPVDWLAMGVFVVGAFGTVLMGLSAFSDDVSTKGGTAKIATEWIAAAGLAPSLLFNAAVAFLGARTFLRGQMRGLGRDLLGSLAVAAGVSIALGVWTSETSTPGGALGAATGGLLKTRAGTALAAIVGAVAIIVPAWIAWLRALALKPTPVVAPDRTAVTHAETSGLSGTTIVDVPEPVAVKPLLATSGGAVKNLAPIPYPADARLRGEIPDGTKPLIVTGGQSVGYEETEALAGSFEVAPVVDDEAELEQAEIVEPVEVSEHAEPVMAEAQDDDETYTPPAPSWERTGLGPDDEPVDAYGTPLSLVEQVRAEVTEEELTEEAPVVAAVSAEYDELEAELSEVAEDEFVSEEVLGEELSSEDDRTEDDLTADDLVEELVVEEEELVASAPVAVEVAPEVMNDAHRPAKRKQKASDEAPGLFDGLAAPVVAETTVETLEATPEPIAELVPQAAAPGKSVKHPALLDAERRRIVTEAGCLFVDRGRVAVSMLQREYGMDFDAACVVLDDLQDLGLIGPYLGGHRRDILLTRDQWMERLASA
jgi:hypothetical protein